MQNTNWIILASKDRGNDYGVGTFIKYLSKGMAKTGSVNVIVIEIGLPGCHSFNIRKKDEVTFFEIPVFKSQEFIDTIKNQEKAAANISRLIQHYIPGNNSNVIHMNFLFQYFLAKELKNKLQGTILYTQHLYLKDQTQ